MSSPFAGGVGSSRMDLCGALTGRLMVIEDDGRRRAGQG
jgi:hypothetical protein